MEQRKISSLGSVELRGSSNGTELSGYAAVYGQIAPIGNFDERIVSGAFNRSLSNGADVRALYNHRDSDVIARRSAGTLKLSEDDKGLRFHMRIPNTQAARDLVENIRHGNISGMSIGFVVKKERWTRSGDRALRSLVEVDLIEVSPVTFPAYEGTSVSEL